MHWVRELSVTTTSCQDLGHEFILGDDPAHITGKQAEDSKGPRSQGNVSPASREQLAALQIDVVAWKAQLPCEFTSIAQRRRLTSRWLFEARRVDFRTRSGLRSARYVSLPTSEA